MRVGGQGGSEAQTKHKVELRTSRVAEYNDLANVEVAWYVVLHPGADVWSQSCHQPPKHPLAQAQIIELEDELITRFQTTQQGI